MVKKKSGMTDKQEFAGFSEMPPLEDDEEEVEVGNLLIILTPNDLLTRLSILLAQIKAGND